MAYNLSLLAAVLALTALGVVVAVLATAAVTP